MINILAIIWQIAKEFWFPLVASLVWTRYNFSTSTQTPGDYFSIIADFCKVFAPAFFFTSWLTGQFVRVMKQMRVDSGLKKIESSVSQFTAVLDKSMDEITKKFDVRVSEIIGNISGGDSFPVYHILLNNPPGHPFGNIICYNIGKHPLFDVSSKICDLQQFSTLQHPVPVHILMGIYTDVSINLIIPGYAANPGTNVSPIAGRAKQDYNIFTTARNGSFTQCVRMILVGQSWICATKVEKKNADDSQSLVHENIDAGFPRNPDGSITW